MLRVEQPRLEGEHRYLSPAAIAPQRASALSNSTRCPLRDQIVKAALVQRSLLPDVSMPVGEFSLAALYRPCESLAGDFYDLAWRPECALLLVADVMGHGLDAALITMLVKATFQDAAAETADPGALLAGMDARLRRMIPDRMFVAAAAARIDRRGTEVEVANAGLPHPLVVRAAGRKVEDVPVDGLPLTATPFFMKPSCHTAV
jgi:sigma-B regulation protein RsbU (phosphoserine phosphatase)